MKAKEITNFIMNGGTTAKGKGRENLQQTGIEMIHEYTKQKCKEQRELCAEMKQPKEAPNLNLIKLSC